MPEPGAAADTPRQTALRFFKALADESRLRIVGILAAASAASTS